MKVQVLANADSVARQAATDIAAIARQAVGDRGRFVFAVSGGKTPWLMLRYLAQEDMPWSSTHLFQVDERIAPAGDPDRNLTHLRESLLDHVHLRPDQIHVMPVDAADLKAAAIQYSRELVETTSAPAVLDLVHLGLGPDGHTASLIPGDPVLAVTDADVASTGIYQGRHRLTLTFPPLNRARQIMWLITGKDKGEPLTRLLEADNSIPAGRVSQHQAIVLADTEAATDNIRAMLASGRLEGISRAP